MSSAQPASRLAAARSGQARLTGAEVLAVTALVAVAGLIVWSYLLDRLGSSLSPPISVLAAAATSAVFALAFRKRVERARTDLALFLGSIAAMAGYLLWLARPDLLPTGSGPDLTHHLLLIDYIERQGHLVRDPQAGAALGEMAHYTPGLHLLTAVAAALARTDGFHALYPVIALTVALKVGFLSLTVLRLLPSGRFRAPLTAIAVLMIFALPTFTVDSFTHDSFFAQVAAELFAIALWWTLTVWHVRPMRSLMVLFAFTAVATFLTWPVWIGPPLLSLVIIVAMRRDVDPRNKLVHLAIALAPLVFTAGLHAAGRTQWVSIVATSGAVAQPSPTTLGFALMLVAQFITSFRQEQRVLLFVLAAIYLQAIGLWVIARRAGADTPYMAIKMIYLGIYPAIASATIALSALPEWASRGARLQRFPMRTMQATAWVLVIGIAVAAARHLTERPAPRAVVSNDLWTAGRWARDNLPGNCVDYLVANEYTAYWLHLAVLRNSRSAARTGNDETFLTQPSMARWLVPDGLKYAVADLAVLPAEIRREVDVLRQIGNAAVIARRGSTSCP